MRQQGEVNRGKNDGCGNSVSLSHAHSKEQKRELVKNYFSRYIPPMTEFEREFLHELRENNKLLKHMSAALTDLSAAVAANTTAVNAAVAVLQNPPTGTPDSALVPLTTAIVANNAALTAALPVVVAPTA